MGFWPAFIICCAGVAGLFWLDHGKSGRNSGAQWLPVVYLWIIGSRPLSAWLQAWFGFGAQQSVASLDAQLDGSPVDAVFLGSLLLCSLMVLLQRKWRTGALLKANLPLLIYFAYCLASVFWSPLSGVAFKRWIKSVGDLVMVFVIMTDNDPIEALHRLFSRVGFVLLPASVLLVRYSAVGRGFDPEGRPSNTGVTTNKNTLGLITFTIALGAIWNFRTLLNRPNAPNRRRRLISQGSLFAFSLVVLWMANSMTSILCLVLGGGLMILTGLRWVRRHPTRMHTVVLASALVTGVAMASGVDEAIVHALGRNTDLTGRTEIWKTVLPMARNPIIGAGFESFWNASADTLHRFTGPAAQMFNNLVSAHNGYIDVYLNLGWVGVCLIVIILITGYWRASKAFQRDAESGGLILAYIITAGIYAITEAGFRMLTPTWFFLLMAMALSSSICVGLIRVETHGQRKIRAGRRADPVTEQDLSLHPLWENN